MSQAGGFQNVSEGGGVTGFTVDAFTAPGTNPVLPSNGLVKVTGRQVSAGTIGAPVIQTDSLAANTYTIEIQRSAAVSASNSINNGVAHFNSAFFSVNSNGFVSLTASPPLTITSVNHAESPYAVLSTDQFLACQTSTGTITIQLPNAPTTGRVITIKDSNGASNTNNISVTTVGGVVTIDGSTTFTMNTNYSSINVIFDGSNYEVF